MTGKWAITFPADKAQHAAALRLCAGIRVCNVGEVLWLTGEELPDDLDRELRKLPGARRFQVGSDGVLTPQGARVPTGTLPEGAWNSAADWFRVVQQTSALSGEITQRAALRLVRTGQEEPATVLVTSLAAWKAYAALAPLVRLRGLRFAASDEGRTLIRGAPLPPLAGQRCVERGGIAVPCGFMLWPAVDATTLRALLGTGPDDLALFDETSGWEMIPGEDFVQATRAAVHATAGAL